MGIAKVIKASTGATVAIMDDCYINNTPARNRELRAETARIAEKILMGYAAKQAECARAYEARNGKGEAT